MPRYDLFITFSALCLASYFFMKRNKRYKLPLPPGPKGLPLIGNLWDLPKSFEWVTYREWCKDFNTDILHLNVAGTSLIILDSAEAATELLERRSSIYSDRARLPMIRELMGWDFNFGLMPYGEYWRKHRRIMHQAFHPTASRQFHLHEIKATRNMLNRFLDYPNSDVIVNLRQMAGETIMSVAYGIDVQPQNDPYIMTAEHGIHGLVVAAVPGTFLVDALPFLKYVPEWVPGAGFQKTARKWKVLARRMIDEPFAKVKKDIASGVFRRSFASDGLQKMEVDGRDDAYQEDIIQNTAGTMYTAGSDTTVSAISSCILGLLENPQVLQKAQKELDSVLKPGHLPDFDDEPSLPYIMAIVKETMRWRDVTPIGVPHLLSVDDEYKGYRIPAGSVIIPNAWAMLHNEEIYSDPFRFNPDRFIDKNGKIDLKSIRDPAHATWGFGRRICPGRYMAFNAVWLAVASIIAVFDIRKEVDENGKEIQLGHEYISALVCMPKPFKCQFIPRSKDAEALIRSASLQPDF